VPLPKLDPDKQDEFLGQLHLQGKGKAKKLVKVVKLEKELDFSLGDRLVNLKERILPPEPTPEETTGD
jgi:hypothetical protein